MKICIIINADTRQGSGAECSTVGDFAPGSLQGVRSFDFLTDSVVAVARFFSGHPYEIFLSIDEHERLPYETREFLLNASVDNGARLIRRWEISPKDRSRPRWNDHLYLDTLRYGLRLSTDATHVVHIDQDTALFRDPNCDIVQRYLDWLENGYAYVCQPFNCGDPMSHASTRFFICKRETMDFDAIERRINEGPCLEHVLGRMAGGKVLYPPAELDQYLVISWARYYKGLMRKLNSMPFEEVTALIQKWGILGPNDVLGQRL